MGKFQFSDIIGNIEGQKKINNKIIMNDVNAHVRLTYILTYHMRHFALLAANRSYEFILWNFYVFLAYRRKTVTQICMNIFDIPEAIQLYKCTKHEYFIRFCFKKMFNLCLVSSTTRVVFKLPHYEWNLQNTSFLRKRRRKISF